MKKVIRLSFLTVLSLVILSSCNSDEQADTIELTNEESAEQVASVVSTDITGLAKDMDVLVSDAEEKSGGRVDAIECDVSYDTLINYNYNGPNVTFEYNFGYTYTLDCNVNIPQSITVDFETDGSYEGPRISSSGSSEGQAVASGLGFSSSSYIVNGSFNRAGMLIQQNRGQNSFNSEANVELTNITIEKSNNRISGGTASVNINGTGTNGGEYQFSTTVTFQGGGRAQTEINGTTYEININTGEITPVD